MSAMIATYIPLKPPTKTVGNNQKDGLISLEPEVLAACLARYSRTNEGIESILKKYGGKDPTTIFKFIDYGHASIGGLTGGIAIAIDNVSMLAALKLFEFSQMTDGQESSTRYIELNPQGVVTPQEIGIKDDNLVAMLNKCIELGFSLYQKCLDILDQEVSAKPSIARIPQNTPEKTAQRMLKNYGLDRCRYFLPMCAKTNLALVMSARSWAQTLKELESLPWEETTALSKLIREELKKAAPDLVRHSYPDNASTTQCLSKIERANTLTKTLKLDFGLNTNCQCQVDLYGANLTPWESNLNFKNEVKKGFDGKSNRYSICSDIIRRISNRCTWSAMALAEVRDLNRHRTGFRSYHSIPMGFFLPEEIKRISDTNPQIKKEIKTFLTTYSEVIQKVLNCPENYKTIDYFFFLGTQVPFEHTQQLDKLIYEIELRTGLGAHFKYAEHLKDAAKALIKELPELKEFIEIGSAEPE
jgi:thymidylate synthase ThyX